MKISILAFSLVFTMFACDGEEAEKKPCPIKGIGVESASGTSCASEEAAEFGSLAGTDCRDQVALFNEYGCSEPQICADQPGGIYDQTSISVAQAARGVNFLITNCSTGNEKLVISKVIITGDDRCSFTEPEIEAKEIDPGGSIAIRSTYKPTSVGEDHAAFVITTNAGNFPEFILPICGRGVEPQTSPAPDGGVDPEPTVFTCKDVQGKINSSCHAE